MKTFLVLLGAAALLAWPTARQSASAAATWPVAPGPARPALSPDEQLFTGLVEQVGAAIGKGDMVALGKLMAPDYTHYNPNNEVGHKADELANVATWPPTTVRLVGPVQVRRAGNLAVTVSQHLYSSADNGPDPSRTVQHMIAWALVGGS